MTKAKIYDEEVIKQIQYEDDPMYQAIRRASARALIRMQQDKYLAEYMQMLRDTGQLVDKENIDQFPDSNHT